MKRLLLAAAVACILFSVKSSAQVSAPRILNYQAAIQSADGKYVSGQRSITVRLYRDESGTQPAWSDTFDATLTGGVLDLQLGSHKPLPSSSELEHPLWLGISIDGAAELKPYAQLGASPYALSIADRSVTANKMATDYVGSISINGQKLSGQGANVNFITGDGLDMTFDATTNSVMLSNSQSSGSLGKGASIQGPDTVQDVKVGDHGHKTGILNFANAVNDNFTFVKAAASTTNRNYLIPDVGGDASFVMSSGNQIVGGVKTFSSGIVLGAAFSMSGNPIQNLANPSNAQDASTKNYVDNAVSTVTSALNSEISNRTSAVTSEATTRAAADNALSAAIAAEAAARSSADNALTSVTNSETAARVAADNNEAIIRANADASLSSYLSSEASSRGAVDAALQSQIDALTLSAGLVHITGAETITGPKTFTSLITGDISGNAESVTNGVYTYGDQIIEGVKTFTSPIQGSVTSIGGKPASQVAASVDATIAATPNNISNAIVKRNGSGGFTIGMITGSISGGTVSGSSITSTTASAGLTIGTGNNATSLTSSATSSAKTVTLPNYTGTMAVVLKASGALDGSSGTVDITLNGAVAGDYVIVTRKTFASGGTHHNGIIAALAGSDKVTVRSDDSSDDSSFQVMVIKQ
jgi:hypothetical protein